MRAHSNIAKARFASAAALLEFASLVRTVRQALIMKAASAKSLEPDAGCFVVRHEI
jgi:hypothetical protein